MLRDLFTATFILGLGLPFAVLAGITSGIVFFAGSCLMASLFGVFGYGRFNIHT